MFAGLSFVTALADAFEHTLISATSSEPGAHFACDERCSALIRLGEELVAARRHPCRTLELNAVR